MQLEMKLQMIYQYQLELVSSFPNDVAAWSDGTDHSSRVELVTAGIENYQDKEGPFGSTTRTSKSWRLYKASREKSF